MVPFLSEQWPGRIAVQKNLLRVCFLTGEHFWPTGMAISGECLLWVDNGGWERGKGLAAAAALGDPLFATCTPSRYCSSGNFGDLLPGPSPAFPLYELIPTRIDRLFQQEREKGGWYGWRDFGDWAISKEEWGNLEYDTALGFLLHFARTANIRYLRGAGEMVGHWVDIDILHSSLDGEHAGLPWMHGKDHRGGFEVGHVWIEGPLLYGFLTGDEAVLEVCRNVGRVLREHYVSRKDTYALERNAGWLLIALAALHENFPDGSSHRAMEDVALRILGRQQPDGGFFTMERTGERLVGSSPWTTGGIILEGLYRYYQLTRDKRAKEAIKRAGRWILREGWNEGEGRFFGRILRVDPLAPPVSRGRLLRGPLNLFVAQAMGYAFAVSGERRFLRTGRAVFEAGMNAFLYNQDQGDGRTWSRILRGAPRFLYFADK